MWHSGTPVCRVTKSRFSEKSAFLESNFSLSNLIPSIASIMMTFLGKGLLSCLLILCILQWTLYSTLSAPAGGKKSGGQTGATSESKIQQIIDLAAASKGNVITLDDSSYNYYAINKPRPYSLVVFLTAAHPKFKCAVCKQLDAELTLVAQSYRNNLKADEEPTVFFLRLDYEQAPKTFQSYGVNSVPMLFYVSPLSAIEKGQKDFTVSARDRFQIPASPDAESIASFLRDRTGVSVEIKRSQIWAYLTLLLLFAGMAAAVRPVLNALPFILSLVRQKFIWVVISSGIYTCAISGLIFDIIRSPQM